MQQGVLIRQLQEQHYEQYMRQLYQQQQYAAQQQQLQPQQELISNPGSNINLTNNNNSQIEAEAQLLTEGLKAVQLSDSQDTSNDNGRAGDEGGEHNENDEESDDEGNSSSTLAAASMWTRKDIKEFKESVKSEGSEAIIRIGQGESVTVRFSYQIFLLNCSF